MRRIHSPILTPATNYGRPCRPGAKWRSPLGAGLLSLLLLMPIWLPSQTTRYWDRNRTTAGAGGPTPAGTWSGGGSQANWNTDSDVSWVLTNGALAALTGTVARPTPHMVQTNSTLTFSCSGSFKLQAQTNETGLKPGDANWFDYPNGSASPVNVTIDQAHPGVFFRLKSP